MSTNAKRDADLLERIATSDACAAHQVTATVGERFGILVHHRDQAVGLWSFIDDAYVFRTLASWEIIHAAADLEIALALTLGMAMTGRWLS